MNRERSQHYTIKHGQHNRENLACVFCIFVYSSSNRTQDNYNNDNWDCCRLKNNN